MIRAIWRGIHRYTIVRIVLYAIVISYISAIPLYWIFDGTTTFGAWLNLLTMIAGGYWGYKSGPLSPLTSDSSRDQEIRGELAKKIFADNIPPEDAYKLIDSENLRKRRMIDTAHMLAAGYSQSDVPTNQQKLVERLVKGRERLHIKRGRGSDFLAFVFIQSIVETLARSWLVTPEGFDKPKYRLKKELVSDPETILSLETEAIFILANMLHDKESYLQDSSGSAERLIQRMNLHGSYPEPADDGLTEEELVLVEEIEIESQIRYLTRRYDFITAHEDQIKYWAKGPIPKDYPLTNRADMVLPDVKKLDGNILFRPSKGLPDQDETVSRVEYFMQSRQRFLSRLLHDPWPSSVDISLSAIDRVSIETSIYVFDCIDRWFEMLNRHGKIVDNGQIPPANFADY